MEKARFWASLEMFQYVSDMTPSALGYSNHFGGWRRYSWAGGGEAIVGHFWILSANKPASVCIHISFSKSTNLLPQEIIQFCKTLKNSNDQTREPENMCQKQCPQEAVIKKWVGKQQNPWATYTSHIDFCSIPASNIHQYFDIEHSCLKDANVDFQLHTRALMLDVATARLLHICVGRNFDLP
jgi:hypothetical protein